LIFVAIQNTIRNYFKEAISLQAIVGYGFYFNNNFSNNPALIIETVTKPVNK
jgi:hypothetical protein